MIVLSKAFSIATSRPGVKRKVSRGMPRQRVAARVHHENLRAALRRLLEECRGDRMIFRRLARR